MRKFSTIATLSVLIAGTFAVGAAPAQAAGCAQLTSTYQSGASHYAVVKNVCGTTLSMRAVVPTWQDTGCASIAPGSSHTFRTGGSFSPRANDAAVC